MSAFALSLVLSAAVLHAKPQVGRPGEGGVRSRFGDRGCFGRACDGRPAAYSDLALAGAGELALAVGFDALPRSGRMPCSSRPTGWASSQVYPISRGLAPALVAFGTYAIIGDADQGWGW